MSLIYLPFALVIDAVVGDPKRLWERVPHPVVLIGTAIGAMDRALNAGENRRVKGVALVLVLLAGSVLIGEALERLGSAASILAAAILIAQKSLVDHVKAVSAGLRLGLPMGRSAVAMIVGRDVSQLDEAAVSRAAVESAAENFSDGVIAPAFWYALAGLPGIIAYKAINTADSMIGHKNERYLEFGWAAARLDDLLNLIPARLSALLIAAAGLSPEALRVMREDAARHDSPNAGWPEAAMAGALGLALLGPRSYGGEDYAGFWMNEAGRKAATADDIDAAVRLLWRAWGIFAAFAFAGALWIA